MDSTEAQLRTEEDVDQILRIAVADSVRSDERSLREQLAQAASELGLTEEQVSRAEERWVKERKLRRELSEFMAEQRSHFWPHLAAYVAVNVGLMMFNIADWDGFPWFLFPLVGWGIGIYGHAQEVFNTKTKEFREEFQKWRANRTDVSIEP